jgi:hypothetical protein
VSGPAHRLAINGDYPSRHTAHRGDPGDEAALELLGVENGQDIAKVTMVWCAIFKWAETAQKAEFLDAEEGDLGEALGAGQHR